MYTPTHIQVTGERRVMEFVQEINFLELFNNIDDESVRCDLSSDKSK